MFWVWGLKGGNLGETFSRFVAPIFIFVNKFRNTYNCPSREKIGQGVSQLTDICSMLDAEPFFFALDMRMVEFHSALQSIPFRHTCFCERTFTSSYTVDKTRRVVQKHSVEASKHGSAKGC